MPLRCRRMSRRTVTGLIAAANALRRGLDAPGGHDAEQQLEALFTTSHRLAVYGTLAPGQPNHHIVAPLGGEWVPGLVEGDLHPSGWGAALGYPAFYPRDGGPIVPVQLLITPRLAAAWPDLDAFEGLEYQRVLVPVFNDAEERRLYTVANLYAAAGAPSIDAPTKLRGRRSC